MIDDAAIMEYGQEMIVIREIFDGAHELFENELERAFDYGCPTIVIEPCRLGEETARWIHLGEYLQRYSIITGIGSIVVGYLCPENYLIHWSLLGTALLAHGIHLISWQQDICFNYRVKINPEQFLKSMAISRGSGSSGSTNDPSRSVDNVSLVTSTQELPLAETDEDEDQYGEEQEDDGDDNDKSQPPMKSRKIHQHCQQQPRPTNPYEMIWSTSLRKNKLPVVLCRRSTNELRQTNILNAAVSLLAIAFSFIRYVRSSFWSTIDNTYHSKAIIDQSSTAVTKKWSFLRNFVSM